MVKSCFCRCEMYSDVCIEMKILILYSAIGSMATVDSALFSSSAIRVIKMVVLPLLYISLNLSLAKLVMGHISTLSILQLTIQQSPPMSFQLCLKLSQSASVFWPMMYSMMKEVAVSDSVEEARCSVAVAPP